MTRLTIVIIAALLLGAAALSVAHAQPPAQLSPSAEPATGSISGRIMCARPCRVGSSLAVSAIPVGTLQPFEKAAQWEHRDFLDREDDFFLSSLADGDYFVFVLPLPYEPLTPLPETVSVLDPNGEVLTVPALRITVANGQAVAGVEIVIVRPPGSATGTGSISGRIVFVGSPPDSASFAGAFWLFPPGTPRPFDFRSPFILLFAQLFSIDAEGNFFFPYLAAGDYFLVPIGDLEDATLPLETVATITDSGPSTERAVRVTVGEGQAVTGIELVIRIPEPQPVIPREDCAQPLSPPNGLSPPSDLPFICPPTTGAGPGGADGATGRIAEGLAVAAALLLAGGLALWARSGRAS